MNSTWWFALLSLIATTGYLAIFVALHVLPTGYRAMQHAVSDYAIGRYGRLFRAGLLISSAGVLALAIALDRGVTSPPVHTKDLVFLILIPLARIGMTRFPTDLEGQPVTRRGLTHYALAIAAFTLTYLVISDTTSLLRSVKPHNWVDTPLKVVGEMFAPSLALVVITMFRPLRKAFGLFERVFLLASNLWFVLVALLLMSYASR